MLMVGHCLKRLIQMVHAQDVTVPEAPIACCGWDAMCCWLRLPHYHCTLKTCRRIAVSSKYLFERSRALSPWSTCIDAGLGCEQAIVHAAAWYALIAHCFPRCNEVGVA